jgi:hypothetical protein
MRFCSILNDLMQSRTRITAQATGAMTSVLVTRCLRVSSRTCKISNCYRRVQLGLLATQQLLKKLRRSVAGRHDSQCSVKVQSEMGQWAASQRHRDTVWLPGFNFLVTVTGC